MVGAAGGEQCRRELVGPLEERYTLGHSGPGTTLARFEKYAAAGARVAHRPCSSRNRILAAGGALEPELQHVVGPGLQFRHQRELGDGEDVAFRPTLRPGYRVACQHLLAVVEA